MSANEASGRPDLSPPEREGLTRCLRLSERVPGWTRGDEAEALAEASFSAPDDAVIVEIGSFLGCGTILLASARKLRGSGKVYCVDPFDGRGDPVSVPHYSAILLALWGRSQRSHFDANLKTAGVFQWVEVLEGTADRTAATWTAPIDLLFLDGDQSPEGARLAYDSWWPLLKTGGVIALHNSSEREYESGHEGHRLLVEQEILPPNYREIYCIGSTTFARKVGPLSP